MIGRCDLIRGPNSINPGMVAYGFAIALPCIMVFTSYFYIGWYFCTLHVENDLSSDLKIEFQTTWALLWAFLIYFFLLIPTYSMDFIIQAMGLDGLDENTAYLMGISAYFLQYSTSYLIYFAGSSQYRNAFFAIFEKIKKMFLLKQ